MPCAPQVCDACFHPRFLCSCCDEGLMLLILLMQVGLVVAIYTDAKWKRALPPEASNSHEGRDVAAR